MRFVPLLCLLLLSTSLAADHPRGNEETLQQRDRRLLDRDFAVLAPQRAAKTDLYVLGFAGDGEEDVFRNETVYLKSLFGQRFGAKDRIVTLINHPDSLRAKTPAALATIENLREALSRLGRIMDRDQDLLLLYMTMHGTEDHELAVQLQPLLEEWITPEDLRDALDDAGIRNRVVVISACYAGGFVPALHDRNTLVITAARADRASFGCGSASEATYFGRAWLVDGLNRSTSFIAAYDIASKRIAQRERQDGYEPSLPQIDVGADIGKRIQAWQAGLVPGSPVQYPYGRKRRTAAVR